MQKLFCKMLTGCRPAGGITVKVCPMNAVNYMVSDLYGFL